MKIAHIMPNTNHTVLKSYIRFVNEEFDTEKHRIFFFEPKEKVSKLIPRYENVSFVEDPDILDFVREFDCVILHSSFMMTTENKLKLVRNPLLMEKVVWVSWGADLYEWRKWPKKRLKLKAAFRDFAHWRFMKKIRHFAGIFPPDIEYFKDNINRTAKTCYTPYVGSIYNSYYKNHQEGKSLGEKQRDYDCIHVQIGHQCNPILNHLKVLEDLRKFKGENIKLFLPLSYGDREWGDRVEKMASEIYGDKAVCIREMMDKEEYMKFLANMDIAIFNTERQIGLGNIKPLLYMRKKLYMPEDSVMYRYFNDQGINICEYHKIKKQEFCDFIEPVDMEKGRSYFQSEYMSTEKKIEQWNQLFKGDR